MNNEEMVRIMGIGHLYDDRAFFSELEGVLNKVHEALIKAPLISNQFWD